MDKLQKKTQSQIKNELKKMLLDLKGLQEEAIKKLQDKTFGEEDEKRVKIISSMTTTTKNLREALYLTYDILTQKEKKDLELKEREIGLKEDLAELKSEIEVLKLQMLTGGKK